VREITKNSLQFGFSIKKLLTLIKISQTMWLRILETLGLLLFSLGPLQRSGPEKISQWPKQHYP
jgi:hypothetical protein